MKIAQVFNAALAAIIAQNFNGTVTPQIINGRKMFVVTIDKV